VEHIIVGHLGYIAPEGCSAQALAHRVGCGEHQLPELVKPLVDKGVVEVRGDLYFLGDGKVAEQAKAVEPEPVKGKPREKKKKG
jgi:DNA-binding IclR family transcriptional regulator